MEHFEVWWAQQHFVCSANLHTIVWYAKYSENRKAHYKKSEVSYPPYTTTLRYIFLFTLALAMNIS